MKMKLTIDAPRAHDTEDMVLEIERISAMIEQGFTSGEVRGGWWTLEGAES